MLLLACARPRLPRPTSPPCPPRGHPPADIRRAAALPPGGAGHRRHVLHGQSVRRFAGRVRHQGRGQGRAGLRGHRRAAVRRTDCAALGARTPHPTDPRRPGGAGAGRGDAAAGGDGEDHWMDDGLYEVRSGPPTDWARTGRGCGPPRGRAVARERGGADRSRRRWWTCRLCRRASSSGG